MTASVERLTARIVAAEGRLNAIEDMVIPERRVVAATKFKVETGLPSPQVIEASDGGGLVLGAEGSWRVVDRLTEEVSHTGDTNETPLHTSVMPADSMGPHGIVRIFVSFMAERTGGGAGNHTFKVYFGAIGGGTLLASHVKSAGNLMLDATPRFVWNKGVTNAQSSGMRLADRHERASEARYASTIDTTADVDIIFTVQNAVAAHTAFIRFLVVDVSKGD